MCRRGGLGEEGIADQQSSSVEGPARAGPGSNWKPTAFGGTGLAAIVAYLLLPGGADARDVLYSAIGVVAVLVMALAVRRLPRAERLPWVLLLVGACGFVLGDGVFDLVALADGHVPVPSVADAVYLGLGYPPILAGSWLVARRVCRYDGFSAVLDAAIVTTACTLAQVVFLLVPTVDDSGSTSSRILRVAYPAIDLLAVIPLVRLLWARRGRMLSHDLLAASIAVTLVADEAFYARGIDTRWTDAGWLLGYVLLAVSAWVHRVTPSLDARTPQPLRTTTPRLALLAATTAVPLAVVAIETARDADGHGYVVAAFGLLLMLLAFARVRGLVRLIERLRLDESISRVEAEEANEQLREAGRLKDEFLAVISHDLRMPLAASRGYVELLLEGDTGRLTEEQEGALAVVGESMERILGLANDLLFVASAEAGRLELDAARVELVEIAHRAVAAAAPAARERGLRVTYDGADRVEVFGDASKLARLVDNLLANAIAYTPDGGTIALGLVVGRESADLSVADTGIGIPAEQQARLFESFYRGADPVTGGAGLGLFVAKTIVDAHGGEISVESEPGVGSTFVVRLPLADLGR